MEVTIFGVALDFAIVTATCANILVIQLSFVLPVSRFIVAPTPQPVQHFVVGYVLKELDNGVFAHTVHSVAVIAAQYQSHGDQFVPTEIYKQTKTFPKQNNTSKSQICHDFNSVASQSSRK